MPPFITASQQQFILTLKGILHEIICEDKSPLNHSIDKMTMDSVVIKGICIKQIMQSAMNLIFQGADLTYMQVYTYHYMHTNVYILYKVNDFKNKQ